MNTEKIVIDAGNKHGFEIQGSQWNPTLELQVFPGKTLGSEAIIRNIIGGENSEQMIFTNKDKIGKTHKRQN